MAKKNTEILNAIREEASTQFRQVIPQASEADNGVSFYEALQGYPILKNEFDMNLVNKIMDSVYHDRMWTNKLAPLKRSEMVMGAFGEQLYIDRAERKNRTEHFTGSTSVEGDLLGTRKAKSRVRYVQKNYEYKYTVSIDDSLLRRAFQSEYGLSEYINHVVMSLQRAIEEDEYEDILRVIFNFVESGKDFKGEVLHKQVSDIELQPVAKVEGAYKTDTKNLLRDIRATVGKLDFLSTKYNSAGVKQHSQKEDLVLFITPDVNASIDVDTLAGAFNVSFAEIQTKVILVDKLPTKVCSTIGTEGEEAEVFAILMDKKWLECKDEINKMNSFYNPAELQTNYFAHKRGMMESCLFENMIVFANKDI